VGLGVLALAPLRDPAGSLPLSASAAVELVGLRCLPGWLLVNWIVRSFLRRVGWIIAGALIFGAASLLGIEIPR